MDKPSTSANSRTIPILLCEDCGHKYATEARYWTGHEMVTRVLCLSCHCNRMVTGQDDLYARMIAGVN